MPLPERARLALATTGKNAIPLTLLERKELHLWMTVQTPWLQNWLRTTGFTAEAGQVALVPDDDGEIGGVVVGYDGDEPDMWALAGLPYVLPAGAYELTNKFKAAVLEQLTLGWALGAYKFSRFLAAKGRVPAQLVLGKGQEQAVLMAESITMVRDLINTPANHLGPQELADAIVTVAKKHKAKVKVLKGEELLEENYPAVYEVGKGSAREPMLVDFTWGDAKAPKLTLVGKGVVFDTGGLDIKPSVGMLTMKKDMGGAAHVLALAHLIMSNKLKVRLRVLVPIVENSVSGRAFRPSDIINTRSGKTVEVGNTDAEGRLILCDALYEAATEKPDWLIDFATLTGAGWAAVGPQMGVFFSNDDKLAARITEGSSAESDPLWRLPLWQPYAKSIKGKISDLNNNSSLGSAGAITAALYLEQFLPKGQSWAHFDVRAWNESARPGRPDGGEAFGLRACYAAIESKFGKAKR